MSTFLRRLHSVKCGSSYLWVFWINFLGVDFRVCGDQFVPPFHLVDLKDDEAKIVNFPWTFMSQSQGKAVGIKLWFNSALPSPGARWRFSHLRSARSSPPPSLHWKARHRWRVNGPSGQLWGAVAEHPPPRPSPSTWSSPWTGRPAGPDKEQIWGAEQWNLTLSCHCSKTFCPGLTRLRLNSNIFFGALREVRGYKSKFGQQKGTIKE